MPCEDIILRWEKTNLRGDLRKGTHHARECAPFGGI